MASGVSALVRRFNCPVLDSRCEAHDGLPLLPPVSLFPRFCRTEPDVDVDGVLKSCNQLRTDDENETG